MAGITIEPAGSSDFERCECCGDSSRTVWGFVHRDGEAHAVYYVHWTLGKVAERGAHFDLILGRWGDAATRSERYAVSLEFRHTEGRPGFMVIDATERASKHQALVARGLRRNEVLGTEVAARAFEVIDAVWLGDERIAEVTGHVA